MEARQQQRQTVALSASTRRNALILVTAVRSVEASFCAIRGSNSRAKHAIPGNGKWRGGRQFIFI